MRAGAAVGLALPRAGDWFGRPVNLASRITAVARPGSVLVEREMRESAGDAYAWSYAGERRLRGIRGRCRCFGYDGWPARTSGAVPVYPESCARLPS